MYLSLRQTQDKPQRDTVVDGSAWVPQHVAINRLSVTEPIVHDTQEHEKGLWKRASDRRNSADKQAGKGLCDLAGLLAMRSPTPWQC